MRPRLVLAALAAVVIAGAGAVVATRVTRDGEDPLSARTFAIGGVERPPADEAGEAGPIEPDAPFAGTSFVAVPVRLSATLGLRLHGGLVELDLGDLGRRAGVLDDRGRARIRAPRGATIRAVSWTPPGAHLGTTFVSGRHSLEPALAVTPGMDELVFDLDPRLDLVVAGVVRDAVTGRPLAGAGVEVRVPSWSTSTVCGPDGGFRLGIPETAEAAGRPAFALEIRRTGYRLLRLAVPRGAVLRTGGLDIALMPEGSLRGRVLDADGVPVADVGVTLTCAAVDATVEPMNARGRVYVEIAPGSSPGIVRLSDWTTARTDLRGEFEVDLEGGGGRVEIAVEGHGRPGPMPPPDAADRRSTVRLPRMRPLAVLATGPDDQVIPVAAWSLFARVNGDWIAGTAVDGDRRLVALPEDVDVALVGLADGGLRGEGTARAKPGGRGTFALALDAAPAGDEIPEGVEPDAIIGLDAPERGAVHLTLTRTAEDEEDLYDRWYEVEAAGSEGRMVDVYGLRHLRLPPGRTPLAFRRLLGQRLFLLVEAAPGARLALETRWPEHVEEWVRRRR